MRQAGLVAALAVPSCDATLQRTVATAGTRCSSHITHHRLRRDAAAHGCHSRHSLLKPHNSSQCPQSHTFWANSFERPVALPCTRRPSLRHFPFVDRPRSTLISPQPTALRETLLGFPLTPPRALFRTTVPSLIIIL